MTDIFRDEAGDWYWIPLEDDLLNPARVKAVGPFDSEQEAVFDAEEHAWAPGDPTFEVK
jgi:hypothetical protein